MHDILEFVLSYNVLRLNTAVHYKYMCYITLNIRSTLKHSEVKFTGVL